LAKFGLANPAFRPTLAALVASLKRDPKRYPKKSGQLADARAASLRYRGRESWRAVFRVDEGERTVLVLSFGPHDDAYDAAKRRM
jgi:mRNA-degrading endonuclease RelE of RelBE toxin-antitoxin system